MFCFNIDSFLVTNIQSTLPGPRLTLFLPTAGGIFEQPNSWVYYLILMGEKNATFYLMSVYTAIFRNVTPKLNKDVL